MHVRLHRDTTTDHLGNVRATVSDMLLPRTGNDFDADLRTLTDYYPFGMTMPGRSYEAAGIDAHRYGYNGKENDNEVKGEGNQQDYGFRIYDPRVARFLSVDPLAPDYPWYTPYQFAGNTPIQAIDLDGLEPLLSDLVDYAKRRGELLIRKVTAKIVEVAIDATIGLAKRQMLKSETGTAALLLTEFVSGTGPQHRFFDEEHPFTKALMNSSKIEDVRDYIYDKMAKIGEEQMSKEGVTDWGAKFSPIDVPVTFTLAEQYIGSFNVDVQYDIKSKSLTFTMTNETSLESAGYRVMSSHDRSEKQQFGTIKQTFVATENLDAGRLEKAKQKLESNGSKE